MEIENIELNSSDNFSLKNMSPTLTNYGGGHNRTNIEKTEGFIEKTDDTLQKQKDIDLLYKCLESLIKIIHNPTTSLQEFYDFALHEVIALTNSKIGYIYHYEESTSTYILNSWSKDVMDECYVDGLKTKYNLADTGLWGEAVRQRKPIIENNYLQGKGFSKGLPKGHVTLKRFLTIPIFENEEIVGVVGIANKDEEYTDLDVKHLNIVMDYVWMFSDKTVLKNSLIHARKEAEESDTQFKQLFENITHGFVLFKLKFNEFGNPVDSILTHANPTFKKLYGLKDFDIINNPGKDILQGFEDSINNELENIAMNKGGLRFQHYDHKTDKYYDIVAYSPKRSHFALLYNDITETKKSELELVKAKERIELSEKIKDEFFKNMSHEIRTPLNAIMGFTYLINDTKIDDEERDEYLKLIQSSSNQLLSVISDIITVSSIQTNQVSVVNHSVNINLLLNELQKQTELKLETKPISVVNRKGLSDSESEIVSDKIKLSQILTNLLNNAVKFTKGGHVEFGYTLVNEEELQFYVKDSGIGIDKKRLETIFEWFDLADLTTRIEYGGLGLGLKVARSLTTLLGGRMWIESVPEPGTTVYFTHPYKPISKS